MLISIASARPHSPQPADGSTLPPGAERRRERRYGVDKSCGTAMVLGDEDSRTLCRVLDTSRTGMRIMLRSKLPEGAQMQVEWDGKFFVGAACYRFAKGDSYVVGLELLTCNYGRLPGKASFAFGRLWAFCRVETSRLVQAIAAAFSPGSRRASSRD